MSNITIYGDTSSQPPSTKEALTEYFEQYVQQYLPFKDSTLYSTIIKFLVDYYYEETYNNLPVVFKSLFEEHIIPVELYDQLLISIGIPTTVINQLSYSSKVILLKSFSDFQKYKASIKYVQTLAGAFPDRVSIYEMFLDWDTNKQHPSETSDIQIEANIQGGEYFLISAAGETPVDYYVWFTFNSSGADPNIANRTGLLINILTSDSAIDIANKIRTILIATNNFDTNDYDQSLLTITSISSGDCDHINSGTTDWVSRTSVDAKSSGGWVLKPSVIYKHPSMDLNVDLFDYSTQYAELPNLLVSEEQLDQMKSNNSLVLPIKTNLLLLDYNLSTEINNLYYLISATLLKQIGSNLVTLYFDDQTFSISLQGVIYLWYYLLTKRFESDTSSWPIIPLQYIIYFSQQTNSSYSLADLDTIVSEYTSITTRPELTNFYNNRISTPFNLLYEKTNIETSDTMETTLTTFDQDLKTYILTRIVASDSDTIVETIRSLMDRVYDSLLLFFNNYDQTTEDNRLAKKYSEYLLNLLPQLSYNVEKTSTYIMMYNFKPYHTDLITQATTGVLVKDKFNSLLLSDIQSFIFQLNTTESWSIDSSSSFNILYDKEQTLNMFDELSYIIDKMNNDEYYLIDPASFNLGNILSSSEHISDDPKLLVQPKIWESLSLQDNFLIE